MAKELEVLRKKKGENVEGGSVERVDSISGQLMLDSSEDTPDQLSEHPGVASLVIDDDLPLSFLLEDASVDRATVVEIFEM